MKPCFHGVRAGEGELALRLAVELAAD